MANYTSVTASNICDAAGNKLASGTVSFQATDAANQPLNFQVGGGGQVVTTPATAAITAGAIAGGFQVADSANTSPAGILYRITITDTTLNRVVVTYSLVTVTGTTFNLDNFSQTGAAVLPPVGGSVNGPLTVAGNLNVTGSLGTVTLQKLNNIRFADQFGSLAAAYADLPSTGGTVIVPPGYTETLTASITMNKSYAGFLFMGGATITMGTNTITVPAATHGAFLKGTIGLGGLSGTVGGALFIYSGSGRAFNIGASSATSRAFEMTNIQVYINGVNAATGVYLTNVVYFNLTNLQVTGSSGVNSIGLVCDGTGNFVGTGVVIEPLITFCQTGILATGSGGAASMNAVTILGGSIQSSGGAPMANSIGINLDLGFQDMILNVDIESNTVAVRFGAGALDEYVDIRSEANTTDFQAIAGSQRVTGIARGNASVVVSDAGTNNHFRLGTDGHVNNLIVTGTSNFSSTATFGNTIASTVVSGGACFTNTGATTNQKWLELANTGHTGFYFGIESSVGGAFFTGSNAYEAVLFSPSNTIFLNTPLLRLSSGISVGGGTTLARYARYTPTLSPAAVAANTTAEQTFAGVLTSGDFVIGVSKPTAQAGLGIVGWRANGTSLCITFSNNTASPITPTASEVYQVVGVK